MRFSLTPLARLQGQDIRHGDDARYSSPEVVARVAEVFRRRPFYPRPCIPLATTVSVETALRRQQTGESNHSLYQSLLDGTQKQLKSTVHGCVLPQVVL